MSDQVRITVVDINGRETAVWTYPGKSLWQSLVMNGMELGGNCGGQGTCGKCKLRVSGPVQGPGPEESQYLLADEVKAGERLACYVTIEDEITVYLPADMTGQASSFAVGGQEDLPFSRGIVEYKKIYIPGCDRYSPVSIQERLMSALPGYELELRREHYDELQRLDRAERPVLELNTLIFEGNRVLYAGRKMSFAYGIALDLGSTTLYAALVDLVEGSVAATASMANMQRVYGADILSRVKYCLDHPDGLKTLNQVLVNNCNSLIEDLLGTAGAGPDNIYRYTVVGNPVMLHLFTGLTPGGFAAAPYRGIFATDLYWPVLDTGLKGNPQARVHVLPQIGGFVGADTVACLLAIAGQEAPPYLLLDIGTNGEVVLCNGKQKWAASAAAGPAFEGGNLTSGMRASSGAIDKVVLNPDGRFGYGIIGNKPARGICGSAAIDLVAGMLDAGYIDSYGSFTDKADMALELREGQRGKEMILVPGTEAYQGIPVVFNQEDIRQVQLAKSAIRTAVDILIEQAGIRAADLKMVYLAGAFGNYLCPHSCITIGLLPEECGSVIKNIGHAAIRGAVQALLDPDISARLSTVREQSVCVSLADEEQFQKRFLAHLNF